MLRVENLYVRYGRLTAVRGVSLEIRKGEIVCVVGPNGAGKSTTLASIAGGVEPRGGTILFDGVSLIGKSPEAIARLGISLVPEGRHVFATLSVEENLRIGSYHRRDRSLVASDLDRIIALFPILKERFYQSADRLSGGEQQMLVIARALMTRPRLIMIDEPSLGLAPLIIDQVYRVLLELRERGDVTLFINEQSSDRALRFADRIYVLRDGKIQLEGNSVDLQDGSAIMNAYFGFNKDAITAPKPRVAS
jgi:branched-chain amino acid transport system ATP-binding protein